MSEVPLIPLLLGEQEQCGMLNFHVISFHVMLGFESCRGFSFRHAKNENLDGRTLVFIVYKDICKASCILDGIRSNIEFIPILFP